MLESFSRNDDDEQIGNEKKKFKGSLYKPPTSSELNELKETENLFHSNLFRMQVSKSHSFFYFCFLNAILLSCHI